MDISDSSSSKDALRIAPAFVAYYGLLGVLQPFLPPLLLHRGLSNEQAGTVQGLAALLSSVAPLLASRLLGPRFAPRAMARIFGAAVAIMTLVLASMAHVSVFVWAISVVLFALAWSPMAAIIDTLAVAATRSGRWTYGQLRMSGSFGFILASTALGWLFGHFRTLTLDSCLVAAGALMLATSLLVPNVGARIQATAGVREPRARVPGFMLVLLAAMSLHWCPFGAYQYSYTMLAESVGLNSSMVGIAWSLGVVSEVACFLLADRLIRALGWPKVMAIAFVAAWLRWLLIALVPSASLVVATQLLHGPGFAWFYTAAMAAIAGAGAHRASMAVMLQGLFTGLVTGMGACLGNFWAGWACAHMPIHRLFLLSGPSQLLALGLLFLASRAHRREQATVGAHAPGSGA